MKITSAEFVMSNSDYKKCPTPDRSEFVFIGRSNVGKSSLINMLTGRNKLAKISSKPGKTQLINHFLINNKWYLVDLPGYGWAKASKTSIAKWDKMVRDYLLRRENITTVFVLIDSRIPPQKKDLDFVNWLGENGIPLTLIFTKADKQSTNKTQASVSAFLNVLKNTWEQLPHHFVSSSVSGKGKEDILTFIEQYI